MRVLVVASPMAGHVLPLVPVARALGVAGHEVALATAGEGVTACPLDVPVVDVAPGLDLMRVFAPFLVRHPVLAREQMAGSARGTRGVGVLLAPAAARMAEGVRALVDRLAPDLVVQEPLAAAGAEAAVRAGVPTVLVDGNLFDAEVLYAAATAAYGRRSGIRRFPDPAEVLTTSPPSVVGARRGRPMRFVGTKPDRPWAADLARTGDRPRVLVSR